MLSSWIFCISYLEPSSPLINDDLETIWNIAMVTRSFFCSWMTYIFFRCSSVQKTTKVEPGRVIILSSEGKSMQELFFLEDEGLDFSYCALSCYLRITPWNNIMHWWPWFSPEVFKKTGHSSRLWPFTLFVLEIFIVQALAGGESYIPLTFTSAHCKALQLQAFSLLSCSRSRESRGRPSWKFSHLHWITAKVGCNWIHAYQGFVPAVSNPQGEAFFT